MGLVIDSCKECMTDSLLLLVIDSIRNLLPFAVDFVRNLLPFTAST